MTSFTDKMIDELKINLTRLINKREEIFYLSVKDYVDSDEASTKYKNLTEQLNKYITDIQNDLKKLNKKI